MARPKSIDRNALLEAAERVVEKTGISHLTLDAVAAEAGISKGGLLYCYGTKSALISAMLERDITSFDGAVSQLQQQMKGVPNAAVLAHIRTSNMESLDTSTKAMSMLAALVQSPEHLEPIRKFYERSLAGIDLTTEEGRRARLAFFAAEGVILLRAFGFADLPRTAAEDILNDAFEFADAR
jgi:AcrR family transcriptional regulator